MSSRTNAAPTAIAANGNASSALATRSTGSPSSDNMSASRATVVRALPVTTVASPSSPTISVSTSPSRRAAHTSANPWAASPDPRPISASNCCATLVISAYRRRVNSADVRSQISSSSKALLRGPACSCDTRTATRCGNVESRSVRDRTSPDTNTTSGSAASTSRVRWSATARQFIRMASSVVCWKSP
ncbi:Uncharacterised protein [Mycobacterium tuberculosis]|nr:Uncharacterised protein [Mycobacterium tuberculosis]